MRTVLVIGCGNPARGDDGVAWHALKRLAMPPVAENVTILLRQQLTPELADPASRAQRAVFVDASALDPPGLVHCRPISPSAHPIGPLSHHLAPPHLLWLTRAVYGHCPQAFMVSVGGSNFTFTRRLSPQVNACLPELLDCIRSRF